MDLLEQNKKTLIKSREFLLSFSIKSLRVLLSSPSSSQKIHLSRVLLCYLLSHELKLIKFFKVINHSKRHSSSFLNLTTIYIGFQRKPALKL